MGRVRTSIGARRGEERKKNERENEEKREEKKQIHTNSRSSFIKISHIIQTRDAGLRRVRKRRRFYLLRVVHFYIFFLFFVSTHFHQITRKYTSTQQRGTPPLKHKRKQRRGRKETKKPREGKSRM